ncbi:hypothetical protein AB7M22_001503 [Pseudomonas sp. ADAK2 TE3594]
MSKETASNDAASSLTLRISDVTTAGGTPIPQNTQTTSRDIWVSGYGQPGALQLLVNGVFKQNLTVNASGAFIEQVNGLPVGAISLTVRVNASTSPSQPWRFTITEAGGGVIKEGFDSVPVSAVLPSIDSKKTIDLPTMVISHVSGGMTSPSQFGVHRSGTMDGQNLMAHVTLRESMRFRLALKFVASSMRFQYGLDYKATVYVYNSAGQLVEQRDITGRQTYQSAATNIARIEFLMHVPTVVFNLVADNFEFGT